MKIFENKKSKNLKKNKSAFTLIELIVVITILAILGTIAFIGFSGYSAKARDSVRTTELSDIKKGLELYRVEASKYPTPDNKVEITDNSTTYIYQGNTGELVTSIIGGNSEFKDPKTDKYYTYIVNKNKNKFRLAGIYENYQASGNSLAVAAEDKTYLKFLGDDLAYYTNSTGTPIEQLDLSADNNKINITGDISAYKAVTSGGELIDLPTASDGGVKLNKSCLTRMQYLGDTSDGVYNIDPAGDDTGFDVYCDMTTDGGGWTVLAKTGRQTAATVEHACDATYSVKNLETEDSDYLIACDVGQTEILVNQVEDGWVTGTSYEDGDVEDTQGYLDCAVEATKTGVNTCPWVEPSNEIDNKSYKLLKNTTGINFQMYRIWRVGLNNAYGNQFIYDAWNTDNGIGNWDHYRDKDGFYGETMDGISVLQARTGNFGYIGVR